MENATKNMSAYFFAVGIDKEEKIIFFRLYIEQPNPLGVTLSTTKPIWLQTRPNERFYFTIEYF